MNEKALKTLEFNAVRDKLAAHAGSAPGRALCRAIEPLTDINEIEQRQTETQDALNRLFKNGRISFGSTHDIRGYVKRLEVGSVLGAGELLHIGRLLQNVALVKAYSRTKREEEAPDSLDGLFDSLDGLRPLADAIEHAIISEDEIADSASPGLARIRRQIRLTGDRVRAELSRLIGSSARDYLQDALITTRDGRYCVPVKAGNQNHVPGIVHDTSATGSTLFIEPAAVVKLNNEIRELENDERREIAAILKALSEQAAEHSGQLMLNYNMMTTLDFIFARAGLAMEMNATRPIFNNNGYIELKKARHPLIDKKKVVPIDIRLGGDFTMLVITGPNTGGKTVSLKTTGLLLAMGLAGLHIPTADRSRLSVFNEIYADIGDEQSIEQSLSTFSAHMTHVVSFLQKADRQSLVLFDELGAGTDPTEGAALAIAILMYLHKKHIRTMATTHYSELKMFALRTDGVVNGACEFDVETLSPTYRLLIGVPGKSNAFAISRKLGLPDHIIDRAKEELTEKDEAFEDVISDLEAQRKAIENERLTIEKTRQEAERLRKDLEEQKKNLALRREKLIAQSSEEASRILQKAKDYADQTIRYYNKHGGTDSAREMEEKRANLRKKIDQLDKKNALTPEKPARKGKLKASDLKLGDDVLVLSLNLKGTISTLPDNKGNLFVTIGIMRTKVKLDDLELIQTEETTKKGPAHTGAGSIRVSKSMSVSPEINLLGRTVDDAIAELDKYLDDAYMSHLNQVRVVHGKGTGALRKGIHDYLRRQKFVRSYRLGEYGEGDAGVTIVEFRN
ncbi:MAG: endonuclease MutS2 [Lachnospiraceae bacterium]|nr:endonuclease MutS2 [Lachnospiraceae bacterium]